MIRPERDPRSLPRVPGVRRSRRRRDPASFWDPQAYSRLRRVKAALDPRGPDPVQPSHPARHHPQTQTDTRKDDHAQPHHYYQRGLLAPPTVRRRGVRSVFGTRGDGDTVLFQPSPNQEHCNKCSILPGYDKFGAQRDDLQGCPGRIGVRRGQ